MIRTKKTLYLGEEKLSKLLFKFALPCIIALLIGASYNIVDQIFIGNSSLGVNGSAATGIVFPIIIISQAFSYWFGDGCAAFLSICQGKKDTKNAEKSVGNTILFSFLTSIILMVLFLLIKNPLLSLFGATEQTMELSSQYFVISMVFLPVYMILCSLIPVIRSDGSPIFSMICMGVGALVNVALDPVFIFVLKMGMEGAAWATVIGQSVSFLIAIVYLFMSNTFKVNIKSFVPNFKAFKNALILGFSSFVTEIGIVAISLVTNLMVKRFAGFSIYGVDRCIAAIATETKVFTIMTSIAMGIANGGQPIVGYNTGAGNYDRVKKIYKMMLFVTLAITLTFTIVNELFPEIILAPFGGMDDPLYVEIGKITLRVYLISITLALSINMTCIFFQSVGKPVQAMGIIIFRDLIVLLALLVILPNIFENIKEGSGIIALLWSGAGSDVIVLIPTVYLLNKFFKEASDKHKENSKYGLKFNESVEIIKSKPGPIISISRQHGTNAKSLGLKLAEYFDVRCYSKEIISLIAERTGLTPKFLTSDGLNDNSNYIDKNVNLIAAEATNEILNKIANNGGCVIIGRAADYVLRERQNLLRVFIYADEEFRVQNIMKMFDEGEDEARMYLEETDRIRSEYFNKIATYKWGDKNYYDLYIDGSMSEDEMFDTIVNYINNNKEKFFLEN